MAIDIKELRASLATHYDQIDRVPQHIKTAELAFLKATEFAIKQYAEAEKAYLEAVDKGIPDAQKPKFKINGSAGFTIFNKKGQVLLARGKKDEYTTMSGGIKPEDFLMKTPVSVNTAVREGNEESHGTFEQSVLTDAILRKGTLMLPNAGMKQEGKSLWPAPVFVPQIENLDSERLLASLNRAAQKAIQLEPDVKHEITGYAWIDLSAIFAKQNKLEEAQQKYRVELKGAHADLSPEAFEKLCRENKDLKDLYDAVIEVETVIDGNKTAVKIGAPARRTFAVCRALIEEHLKRTQE